MPMRDSPAESILEDTFGAWGRSRHGVLAPSMPSGEETRQPQRLAHRPRLERAAARRVRRVAVGDLRQMPEPRVVEMREQGVEEARARLGARRRRAAPDAHPGLDERAHEPRPDRALMVRAVALAWTARVARRVAGLAGGERAEAERGH